MRRYLWVFIVVGIGIMGCGQPKQASNTETLTVSEADKLLSQPSAQSSAPASASAMAQPAKTIVPPAESVSNIVVNSEAGSLSETTAAAPLQESTEGPDAKLIQQALKNLGLYSGAVDGKIGKKTKEAVMEFQRSKNLTADGKVGPKTWALLQKALEPAVKN